MKPIVRWNVGPVSKLGLELLTHSVKLMKELYDADFVVTHNQIDVSSLKHLEIELIEQETTRAEDGYQVHWKLFPARLDIDRYEICIDNDIVIHSRLHEIDQFLQEDSVLVYQGIHGLYGAFRASVPEIGLALNSGIYGVPPGYDLNKRVDAKVADTNWTGKYDEQGLLASLLLNYHSFHMIPLTSVPIVQPDWTAAWVFKNKSIKGMHFVGANTSESHDTWEHFKKRYVSA